MVFETVVVLLKGVADAATGGVKTLLDFQHGNPLGFAIIALIAMIFIGGIAVISGKSITGFVIGDFDIVEDTPLWDKYNLTGRPNISQFSIVLGTGWKRGWDGWMHESVQTDDASTWLFQRWDKRICKQRLNETGPVVVWEEVLDAEPLQGFINLLLGGNTLSAISRCGGFTQEVNRITFVDEVTALNTIHTMGNNGTICSDDQDLTVDPAYTFAASCYLIVDENDRRVFYRQPILNKRNNYKWVPVLSSIAASLEQADSYLPQQKLVLREAESAGIMTPFISLWLDSKNIVRLIEDASGLNVRYLSNIMAYIEIIVQLLALVVFIFVIVIMVLSIGGMGNK